MSDRLTLDEKGIWVVSEKDTIMYPEKGNIDSKQLEDNSSFWFQHRNNVIAQVISKYPYLNNFADVGGGNGFQLLPMKKLYPDKKFYLVEPGYQGCVAARERGIEHVYNCVFQQFDFHSNQIDGLGLFDVLEHIPDDHKFLSELYDSMVPGSRLYITLPAYNFLWNDVDDYGKHQRRYDKAMVNALVAKTGFKLLYFTYFFSYLVLPTYILRTIPYRISGNRTDEEILRVESAQHKPSKMQNAVFGWFNKYELDKIRNDGRISFGASCFCVLQK